MKWYLIQFFQKIIQSNNDRLIKKPLKIRITIHNACFSKKKCFIKNKYSKNHHPGQNDMHHKVYRHFSNSNSYWFEGQFQFWKLFAGLNFQIMKKWWINKRKVLSFNMFLYAFTAFSNRSKMVNLKTICCFYENWNWMFTNCDFSFTPKINFIRF